METLKKLEEICQPDIRNKYMGQFEIGQGDYRPLTARDFYEDAERIQLHEDVPEKIQSHFQMARNLIIYSRFYYPFNVTAELCAYTSVEFAFRIKAGDTEGGMGFKALLKEAVAKDWIRDAGFSHVKSRHENIQSNNQNLHFEYQYLQSPLSQEYCKALIDAMPNLRNSLAHGTTLLHPTEAFTVRICADFINQLFERPKGVGPSSDTGSESS